MLAGILLFLKQHVASEGHLAVLLKKVCFFSFEWERCSHALIRRAAK